MLANVKPGGYLAIGDAKRSSCWCGRPFNWVADLLGNGAAGMMSRKPWEPMREMLGDFHYEEWFMGFFYVAAGITRTTDKNREEEIKSGLSLMRAGKPEFVEQPVLPAGNH
ncbi:MAG: hypothetical protein JW963_24105 [Anaerolineales bacterium]|nr:hypothetical protein [Anaerolineales bacterium]